MERIGNEAPPGRPMPTMRDVLAVVFRHRLAFAVTFTAIALAVALSGIWRPQYEAQMKILVQRQRSDAIVTTSPSAPAQNEMQVTEEELNSEVELLNSRDLLATVVRTAHLQASHFWNTSNDPETRVAEAERKLAASLTIEPIRKSHIIVIRYKSRDPRRSAEVLEALATAYKEKHAEVHHPSGEYRFFDQQTEQYRRNLEEAQQQLIDFSKKSGVISAQAEREFALQRADEFEAKAREAEASAARTRQRIRELEAQIGSLAPRLTTSIRTSDNPGLLEKLKNTLLELELKKTGLLTRFEPGYPLVSEVNKQIEETRQAIAVEESKPVREESTDQNPTYLWAREELARTRADLSGLNAESTSAKAIALSYRAAAQRFDQSGIVQQDLLRKAKMQEDGYLLYVHKREEAGISDALDQRRILNVAIAEQPVVPALPRRSPAGVALLGLLFAFTGSMSCAFLLDVIDPTFRTPDELAGCLKTPVLAALPAPRKSR